MDRVARHGATAGGGRVDTRGATLGVAEKPTLLGVRGSVDEPREPRLPGPDPKVDGGLNRRHPGEGRRRVGHVGRRLRSSRVRVRRDPVGVRGDRLNPPSATTITGILERADADEVHDETGA